MLKKDVEIIQKEIPLFNKMINKNSKDILDLEEKTNEITDSISKLEEDISDNRDFLYLQVLRKHNETMKEVNNSIKHTDQIAKDIRKENKELKKSLTKDRIETENKLITKLIKQDQKQSNNLKELEQKTNNSISEESKKSKSERDRIDNKYKNKVIKLKKEMKIMAYKLFESKNWTAKTLIENHMGILTNGVNKLKVYPGNTIKINRVNYVVQNISSQCVDLIVTNSNRKDKICR